MSQREYHIVVLGSGGVGKSCLTEQFIQNVSIESDDSTIERSYRMATNVDGCHVTLEILDTAGTEQFRKTKHDRKKGARTDHPTAAMRELYLKTGHGFLLVFSITSTSSLDELAGLREQIKRIKEDDNVPMVLVGNKLDLEEDRSVSRPKVSKIFQDWGNVPYYETSAKRRVNVDEVFMDLCRQMIRENQREYLGAQERTHTRRQGRGRHLPKCTIL